MVFSLAIKDARKMAETTGYYLDLAFAIKGLYLAFDGDSSRVIKCLKVEYPYIDEETVSMYVNDMRKDRYIKSARQRLDHLGIPTEYLFYKGEQ